MNRPLHIMIAAGVYPPDIGGPATLTQLLEQKLPTHGIAVSVLPFHTVRNAPKVIRHTLYTYHLWKRTRDATHILATDGVSVGLPALVVARWRKIPLFVRLGGDYAWEQGRVRFGVTATLDDFCNTNERWEVRSLATIQAFVCRQASLVIVPSEYLKRIVLRWQLPAALVHVIKSVFIPAPTSRALTVPVAEQEHPHIVSAGRLVPWKGFVTLITTVVTLRSVFPTITLDIFGDGEQKETLQKLITLNQADTYIHMRGAVDSATLHSSIKNADAFVLNTGYEGLSHQLLEVMAIGTPIVTTAISGNQELLQDKHTALLVSYNDTKALQSAIETILTDTSLRQVLIKNAKQQVSTYSATAAVTEYARIFTTTV